MSHLVSLAVAMMLLGIGSFANAEPICLVYCGKEILIFDPTTQKCECGSTKDFKDQIPKLPGIMASAPALAEDELLLISVTTVKAVGDFKRPDGTKGKIIRDPNGDYRVRDNGAPNDGRRDRIYGRGHSLKEIKDKEGAK